MIQPRLSATFCLIGGLASAAVYACGDDDTKTSTSTNAATPGSGGTSATRGDGNTTAGNGGSAAAAASTGAAGNGGTAGTGATETGVTGNGTAAGATATGGAGTAGRGSNADAGVAGSSDAGALGGDAGAVLALKDGQILYVADTLNAGEVDQARAALPKLTNADVRSFANDMITEHGTARDQLLQLADDQDIAPAGSEVADDLHSKSDSAVQRLLAAAPDGTDALYVQLQVTAHVDAAALLDQLITAADSDPLRTQLTDLRSSVQSHLDRARALDSGSM
jgi:putative membrane protein